MNRRMLIGVALAGVMALGMQTTGPATKPAESFPALQKRLRELMEENAALRDQVLDLKAQLAAVVEKLESWEGKPGDVKLKNPRAMRKVVLEQMRNGMGEAEVLSLLGDPDEKSRDGNTMVWTYKRYIEMGNYSPPKSGGWMTPPPVYTVTVWIDSGKVSRITDEDVEQAPTYMPPGVSR